MNREARRRCAAIAAGHFRRRAMPAELAPSGYYEDDLTAWSTARVAREALRRLVVASFSPTGREPEREPTDRELDLLEADLDFWHERAVKKSGET